jgi:hypothetical protein
MEEIKMNKNNKYHNGKIYTIRSYETDKYYIGSTCSKLHNRLCDHRYKFNQFQKGKGKKYISSFNIIKYDDNYIELLECFKCDFKKELTKREGELIRKYKNELVNIRIEGRDKKEYYDDNIEKIKEQKKKYRKENKDKIKDKIKQYYKDNTEKKKQYYKDNTEKIKQYYKDNIDKIKEQKKEYQQLKYICSCGSEVTQNNKSRHMKTKKHIDLMNKL